MISSNLNYWHIDWSVDSIDYSDELMRDIIELLLPSNEWIISTIALKCAIIK